MAPPKRRAGRPSAASKAAARSAVAQSGTVATPVSQDSHVSALELIEECAEHLQMLTTILQALPAAIAAQMNGLQIPPSLPPVDFSVMKRKALKDFMANYGLDVDLDDYEELDEAQQAVQDAYYAANHRPVSQASSMPAGAPRRAVPVEPNLDFSDNDGHAGVESFDFDNMTLVQLQKFIVDHEMEDDVDLGAADLQGKLSLQRVAVEEMYALLVENENPAVPGASSSGDDDEIPW